jgi:hypothetical protein
MPALIVDERPVERARQAQQGRAGGGVNTLEPVDVERDGHHGGLHPPRILCAEPEAFLSHCAAA